MYSCIHPGTYWLQQVQQKQELRSWFEENKGRYEAENLPKIQVLQDRIDSLTPPWDLSQTWVDPDDDRPVINANDPSRKLAVMAKLDAAKDELTRERALLGKLRAAQYLLTV
jgi:hypothetical protein